MSRSVPLPTEPVLPDNRNTASGVPPARWPGYSLSWAAAMAVPKRKTSKARRDQRRATHKLEAPRVNSCPQCGSPKRPHHICPTCGTYKGREIEPLRLQAP